MFFSSKIFLEFFSWVFSLFYQCFQGFSRVFSWVFSFFPGFSRVFLGFFQVFLGRASFCLPLGGAKIPLDACFRDTGGSCSLFNCASSRGEVRFSGVAGGFGPCFSLFW